MYMPISNRSAFAVAIYHRTTIHPIISDYDNCSCHHPHSKIVSPLFYPSLEPEEVPTCGVDVVSEVDPSLRAPVAVAGNVPSLPVVTT